jgi:hypothetical protein
VSEEEKEILSLALRRVFTLTHISLRSFELGSLARLNVYVNPEIDLEFRVGFCGGRKTEENPSKRANKETQLIHMTPSIGIKPRRLRVKMQPLFLPKQLQFSIPL